MCCDNSLVRAILAGRKTLDWAANRGRLVLGADHPRIMNVMNNRRVPKNAKIDLQKSLSRITGYDRIVFTKDSTEAHSLALRIAASWGRKENPSPYNEVALVTPCSVLGREDWHSPVSKQLPFDNLAALEGELWTNYSSVAFMMNAIHWNDERGYQRPNPRYLTEVRRICDKHNILWVTDESATAFGRTGHALAFMDESCHPDIVVVADTLGGGVYTTSFVLLSDRVIAGKDEKSLLKFPKCPLTSHAAAVGLEVVKEYESKGLSQAARSNGHFLRSAFKWALSPEELTDVTGKGLLTAIRIHGGIGSASQICLEMRRRGVFVWPCSEQYISITPPLTTTKEELVAGVMILARVIDSLFEKSDSPGIIGRPSDSFI